MNSLGLKSQRTTHKSSRNGKRLIVLQLEKWLPYRCSLIANAVSLRLAHFYHGKFGLTVHAWRMMAALGRQSPMSALDLARLTAMDQVSVTRALNHLSSLGMLVRGTNAKDRRKAVLRLSRKGQNVYRAIVPLALELEATLTTGLTRADLATLDRMFARVEENAKLLWDQRRVAAKSSQRQPSRRIPRQTGNDRAVRMPRALVL